MELASSNDYQFMRNYLSKTGLMPAYSFVYNVCLRAEAFWIALSLFFVQFELNDNFSVPFNQTIKRNVAFVS